MAITDTWTDPYDGQINLHTGDVIGEGTFDKLGSDLLYLYNHSHVRIADTLLAAPTNSIAFTSIPATYKHLRVLITARGDGATTAEPMKLEFNDDAGNNYIQQYIDAAHATITSDIQDTIASIPGGYLAGDNTAAGTSGVNVIDIPDYASTTFQKIVNWQSGLSGYAILHAVGTWKNTAAITKILLFPGTSTNFVVGTRATLIGVR